LAPGTVTGGVLSPRDAIDLLCACVGRDLLAPGIVVGKDLAYAATALRLAGSLVARQQYAGARRPLLLSTALTTSGSTRCGRRTARSEAWLS
jgi:hypothetical protein